LFDFDPIHTAKIEIMGLQIKVQKTNNNYTVLKDIIATWII